MSKQEFLVADFEGEISFCEVITCGDRGNEVRFNIKGMEDSLRACWAGFRLEAGEHIRAYGARDYLKRVEVVRNGAVVFRW